MPGLTARQAAFVREFLVDLNATAAYRRAGYAEAGARQNAARLMADDSIAAAIAAGMQAKAVQTGVTKARVVAMALDGAERAREAGAHSAFLRAVELLARLHGHITEKRELRMVRSLDDLSDDELAALEADARERERRH